METQQQNGNNMSNMKAMTPAEQQFAMKLSPLHRQIFTNVFTPDLRQEAMADMTSTDNEDEVMPMTEDMAVEQVITNHREPLQMSPGCGENVTVGILDNIPSENAFHS